MDYIIGVDIGTSGTKTVAFDTESNVIGEYRITYPLQNPQPNHFEQDPSELLNAVIKSIAKVVGHVGQMPEKPNLLGVGFSSAMHGIMIVDVEDRPVTPCITWADTRSESFAAALKNTPEGMAIYRATGTPIHPMSPLCKLGWMREHRPQVFASAYKFISIKEYVFFKLFGQYVVDESIASATGLFDVHQRQWHTKALEAVGISPAQLSKPVAATYTLTDMDRVFAAKMGIPGDTPFIIGGSDGCLANLGVGVVRSGDVSVTIGTSGAIRMTADRPKTDEKARTFSYVLTEELHVLGGAVNNGGVVLQWFKDNFEVSEMRGEDSFHSLTSAAGGIDAGSEGLIFLPYLTGERAPHWDAEAKGVFFGIQLHHRKAHFIRAIMEGVIFSIYSVGKVLEEITEPIHSIHANGGFAYSPLWVQILADVFHKRVLVQEHVEGAARGAYLIVLKALGKIASFEDVEDRAITATFDPDPVQHQVYMKNFERFERLYNKLKDEF